MVAVPQTITIPSGSDRQRIIDHAGKIDKSTFTVGFSTGTLPILVNLILGFIMDFLRSRYFRLHYSSLFQMGIPTSSALR